MKCKECKKGCDIHKLKCKKGKENLEEIVRKHRDKKKKKKEGDKKKSDKKKKGKKDKKKKKKPKEAEAITSNLFKLKKMFKS